MRPIWKSLGFRLTLAFVLLSLLNLSGVGLFAVSYTNRQFAFLLQDRARDDFIQSVQAYVEAQDSLDGYQRPRPGQGLRPPGPPPDTGGPTSGPTGPRPLDEPKRTPFLVLDPARRVVTGSTQHPVGSLVGASAALTPVRLNGHVVAYLLASGRAPNPGAPTSCGAPDGRWRWPCCWRPWWQC